jgi:2-hydroxy-6-oxonona-2,4-dienedioate hydrolase
MRPKGTRLFTMAGAVAAGAGALAYRAFSKDMKEAWRRVRTGRQFIESAEGPIEFAESGDGPAVLVSHGAGGGFDQGLLIGRGFLGEGYRIIAPSRFGYLGTALPADASPEAQADAYVRVLDALEVEAVPVLGVSAGAPSALQFCIRHPERCLALVLAVPLAYAPGREEAADGRSPLMKKLLTAVLSSDFVFWAATKVAHLAVIETVLGTPVEIYRKATPEQRAMLDDTLLQMLPISARASGLVNEARVASSIPRYPLEQIAAPALVISAADCLYGTYESALYTAEHIPEGTFVGYHSGGHLLVGHEAEVRREVTGFLRDRIASRTLPAVAI